MITPQKGFGRTSSLEQLQRRVDFADIEVRCVPIGAKPRFHLVMFRTFRIGQDLQQVVIAADAATVFGRTRIFAGEADGMLKCRIGSEDFSTVTSCSQESPKSYS